MTANFPQVRRGNIDDYVKKQLGESASDLFIALREQHFWMWKTHRICDESTLKAIRAYLHYANALTLALQHQLNTREPSFGEAVGPDDQVGNCDQFAGKQATGEEYRHYVSESGDGVIMYENARLGVVNIGYGPTLKYSLESTLENCIRPQIRWAIRCSCKSYLYPGFGAALKTIEVWSEAYTTQQLMAPVHTDDRTTVDEVLCMLLSSDGTLPQNALLVAETRAQAFLDRRKSKALNKSLRAFVTMLSYLIDELQARLHVANCMKFDYQRIASALTTLDLGFNRIFNSLTDIESVDLRGRLMTLLRDSVMFADPLSVKQNADELWLKICRDVADYLREFGFSTRAAGLISQDDADLVLSSSNLLWGWTFFLEQRVVFDALQPSTAPLSRENAVNVLWTWLQRPFAILTHVDIDRAFRGLVSGDDEDDVPGAFTRLAPMLRTSVGAYLRTSFGLSTVRAERSIRQLIRFRQSVFLLRRLTHKVRLEPEGQFADLARVAEAIVVSFSKWIEEEGGGWLRRIAEKPTTLAALIRSGEWLRLLMSTRRINQTLLTNQEEFLVESYLQQSAKVSERVFTFDDADFNIEESLGFFPPEAFVFIET